MDKIKITAKTEEELIFDIVKKHGGTRYGTSVGGWISPSYALFSDVPKENRQAFEKEVSDIWAIDDFYYGNW